MNPEMNEAENKIPSIGVIAISGDRVLLVREGDKSDHLTGMYGLPSGRLKEGESELDAAVREFTEETGLTSDPKDFSELPNNYYEAAIPRKDGTIINFGWRVFRVTNFQGEVRSSEETAPEWVKIERLNELEEQNMLLPNVLNAVLAAFK